MLLATALVGCQSDTLECGELVALEGRLDLREMIEGGPDECLPGFDVREAVGLMPGGCNGEIRLARNNCVATFDAVVCSDDPVPTRIDGTIERFGAAEVYEGTLRMQYRQCTGDYDAVLRPVRP